MNTETQAAYQLADDIQDAMRIRQEIDAKISSLYDDRSINDCAGFMLSYLKSDMKLLDCGCGPGTITVQFASHLDHGQVTGIDANETHVKIATNNAKKKQLTNIDFVHGNLYSIPFPDNTFDAAFAHTVICNLHDPVAALKEMKRVVKPGGIIAAREPDYYSSIIYPEDQRIFRGLGALAQAQTGYSDSTIGRKLRQVFHDAGLGNNQVSASCDYYSSKSELEKIAHYLQSQVIAPDVYESILSNKFASKEQIHDFCRGLDEMTTHPGAMYVYTLIELIGFK